MSLRPRAARARAALLPLAGVALWAGCGAEDFDPQSLLSGYRVVAITAEPPTLTLAAESALEVVDFHPADLAAGEARPAVTYTWRLCPLSLGSVTKYACFVDEVPLTADASGRAARVSPAALLAELGDISARLAAEAASAGPLAAPPDLSALEMYIKVTATPAGGVPLEVVKRLTLNVKPDAPLNANPALPADALAVEEVAGQPSTAGGQVKVTLTLPEGAAERYAAGAAGAAEAREELVVAWSTSAGELERAFSFPEDPTVVLTLPEEPQRVRVFAAVRDGRGGVAVRSVDVDVAAGAGE